MQNANTQPIGWKAASKTGAVAAGGAGAVAAGIEILERGGTAAALPPPRCWRSTSPITVPAPSAGRCRSSSMRRQPGRILFIVAALMMAAGSAWGQGAQFKDVIALDFSKTDDQAKIMLNGAAQWVDRSATIAPPATPRLRLTDAGDQASSAFLPAPMGLSDYQVQFDFEVQKVDPSDTTPADGFTFTAQTAGADRVGGGGGSLGFIGAGISQAGYSYAIEFNSYPPQGLTDNPETVALDLGIPGSRVGDFRVRFSQTPFPFLGNGVFHAVIRVTPDRITATFSGGNLAPDKPLVWSSPSYLGGGLFKPLDSSLQPVPLFLGFTGATGGARSVMDILNFRVQVPA